jgi:hypothetical protein
MSNVQGPDGLEPLPCAAEAIKQGYLYKADGSYNMTKITTVTDVVLGIAAISSIDDNGDAKTLTAGQVMNFYRPGCGKKVKVAMITGITLRRGDRIYTAQTAEADGCAKNSSANSAVCIGTYYGPDNVTTAANGELADVALDTPVGGT